MALADHWGFLIRVRVEEEPEGDTPILVSLEKEVGAHIDVSDASAV